MLQFFLVLLFLGPSSAALSDAITKVEWVAGHDALRALESAGDMQAIKWDTGLASKAETYAQECNGLTHNSDDSNDDYDYIGENIYVSTSEPNVADILDYWYSESENYDYDSNSCADGEECGHYTQLVWANTCAVGCAVAECSSGDWDYVTVCNYGPGGNIDGESPYTAGDACSECEDTCTAELLCENNCDSSSTTTGSSTTTSAGTAETTSATESSGSTASGETTAEGATTSEGSATTSAGATDSTDESTGDADCQNQFDLCEWWAEQGECEKNPDYMLKDCKGACSADCDGGRLAGGTKCVNFHPFCNFWRSKGQCSSNLGFMLWQCKRACHPHCQAKDGYTNGDDDDEDSDGDDDANGTTDASTDDGATDATDDDDDDDDSTDTNDVSDDSGADEFGAVFSITNLDAKKRRRAKKQ